MDIQINPLSHSIRNSKVVGKAAEKYVQKYLQKDGHQIVAKNFKTKFGEIDLISICQNTLYFTEIKFTKGQVSDPYLKWKRKQKFRLLKTIQFFYFIKPQFSQYNSSIQIIWLNQINSSRIRLIKFQNLEINYD